MKCPNLTATSTAMPPPSTSTMPTLRRSQRLRASALLHSTPAKRRVTDAQADQPAPKRLRLTKENLRAHQRLQQQPNNSAGLGRSRKTPTSVSRTTVTTTDKQFASRLVENGVVYEIFDVEPPDDVNEIKAALSKPRELPSQARRDWGKICEGKRYMAQGELTLESMIVESMLYFHDSPANYLRYRNDQWTEIDNEITAGISDPKPDVTEAHTWSAYPPGTREDISELVPSQYGYAMPAFAMESKGPGDHEQAVKQAAYDGTVMTHAALAIGGHVGKSRDSQLWKTKAITVPLSPVEINVYANHAVSCKAKNRLTYHHYRVAKVSYLDSEDEWNRAHAVILNAQDLALGLANSRIKALWDRQEAEKAKQEETKAKAAMVPLPKRRTARLKNSVSHNEIQVQVKATVTPPPSSHIT